MSNAIKCPKCGAILGERIGSKCRVQHEGRVWLGQVEAMTCEKCKCSFDVPVRQVPCGMEAVTK